MFEGILDYIANSRPARVPLFRPCLKTKPKQFKTETKSWNVVIYRTGHISTS